MVGTACFALSPVDGLFRHRSGNYDLPPSSRTKRRLAVSVRRQHRGARTTRLQPSASCAVVIRRTFHVPDLTPHAATASRPAYRDDRETPLMTGRDMANISEVPSAGICIPITKCFESPPSFRGASLRASPESTATQVIFAVMDSGPAPRCASRNDGGKLPCFIRATLALWFASTASRSLRRR